MFFTYTEKNNIFKHVNYPHHHNNSIYTNLHQKFFVLYFKKHQTYLFSIHINIKKKKLNKQSAHVKQFVRPNHTLPFETRAAFQKRSLQNKHVLEQIFIL